MAQSHYNNWAESLDKMIAKKYPSRPVQPSDPSPIVITGNANGPLMVDSDRVLCDKCGHIIRKNYLTQHQESGACARAVERKKNTPNVEDLCRCNSNYKLHIT